MTTKRRYPWQRLGTRLSLDAIGPGMEFKFPYRTMSVSATSDGKAIVRSATMAPTWPPTELSESTTRSDESSDEAMRWCEGVYDEALGDA